MNKIRIMDVPGTEFPSGRITRVLLGSNGAIDGEYFCQGYVIVYPGGTVPIHEHTMVESYTVIQGEGEVIVDGECQPVKAGELVYMEPGSAHGIRNTGDKDMHLMFVYAPKQIAEHWAQEQSGELQ